MRFLASRVILLVSACVAMGCVATLARADAPRRVVSANLCTDQLLLALADESQIVSLSPFALDPGMSFLADQARRFPTNRGTGEDLVRTEADLVLIGAFDGRYTRELLKQRGLSFLPAAPWRSMTDGFDQIRNISKELGHRERGETMIGEIEQAMGELRALAAKRATRPSALILSRRGFVYHAGPLAEMIEAAGLVDAAPSLGVPSSGFVTMENLVAHPPDLLIVSDKEVEAASDQGQAFLAHPALKQLWPASRRLVAPGQLTICGGPSTVALIKALAAEIAAKVH